MRRLGGRKRAGTRPAPTGPFWGVDGEVLVNGRGQAQGLPLRVLRGETGRLGGGGGATDLFGGDGRLGGRERAGTRPAPTDLFGGDEASWWTEEGRHKACPYRFSFLGETGRLGGREGVGTRPALTGSLWGRWGGLVDGRGQAQGLPLQVLFGGDGAAWWTGEGRHKACPYKACPSLWGDGDAQGRLGGRDGGGQAQGLPLVQAQGATTFWGR